MDKAQREALASRALAFAGAGEHEILVFDFDQSLTRFTQNAIHQNVAHCETAIRVRTVSDGRTGVAATNLLDDASVREVVERAAAMAAFAPRDAIFPGLPAGGPTTAPANAYVAATATAAPDIRAKLAADVFAVSERDGLWAAGFVKTGRESVTIANSRGTLASFDGTDAGMNVKQNGPSSTGFAERYSSDVSDVDARGVAEIAAAKVRVSSEPRAVDPGEWTVILEPSAFGELLSYITDHFSAQAYDEGSSFLSEGLDRAYVAENVSVRDDFSHPLAPAMPFDYEGVPKQLVALFENGVAKNVVTDSYWAAKLKRPNTGHALPAPNAAGPVPLNVVVEPGAKSVEQLISETKRGLLISRFWYIRPVDLRQTIVTGMTRDGTFLIENGKIAGGVRNMRFNQSILAALGEVEFASELARSASYSYANVVPAAKLARFRFTSLTDF
jgi:predicted Zn-dependent protease